MHTGFLHLEVGYPPCNNILRAWVCDCGVGINHVEVLEHIVNVFKLMKLDGAITINANAHPQNRFGFAIVGDFKILGYLGTKRLNLRWSMSNNNDIININKNEDMNLTIFAHNVDAGICK